MFLSTHKNCCVWHLRNYILLLARHLLTYLGTSSMHHTTWPTSADVGQIGTLFRAKYWLLLYKGLLQERIGHHAVLWWDATLACYLLDPPNPLNPIIAAMVASSSGFSAITPSCVAAFAAAVRASSYTAIGKATICDVVGSVSVMSGHC